MPLTDDAWRADLHAAYDLFAPLLKQDMTLNLQYAILGGAILWSIRQAPHSAVQLGRLKSACGEEHLPPLQRALDSLEALTPLDAARHLHRVALDSTDLRAALDAMLDYCRTDLLEYGLLKSAQQTISIGGDVSGGNLLIGGTQYVAGDLINGQYLQPPKTERHCPKPSNPPRQFGGRSRELHRLIAQFKTGQTDALRAIVGVGGIGKTTLAKALAHQMYTDKTFRAVLWGDVTRTPDAVRILREWAISYADSAFSTVNLKGERQITAVVKGLLDTVIADQCEAYEPPRVLVVLDDVWDNGTAVVELLQAACPDHTTVLITTHSENVAHDLNASIERLDYLSSEDAAAMLQTYLPDVDAEVLQDLGSALGGHALALKLAAGRVKKESGRPGETMRSSLRRCTAEYQAGIAAGTPFAQLKLEAGEERENNLTLALALSYGDLDDADQGRFRALGVLAFDAPFDRLVLEVSGKRAQRWWTTWPTGCGCCRSFRPMGVCTDSIPC